MTESIRGKGESGLPAEAPAVALGLFLGTLVLVFFPIGLDQFVLPKMSILLAGVPAVAAVFFACRALSGVARSPSPIDRPLVGLVIAYTTWSVVAPLWGSQNRALHLMGTGEQLLMAALCGVSVMVGRDAGTRVLIRFAKLITAAVVGVAVFAVVQSVGLDPLRLLFDLSSSRPGRWQVLTTLGNPTWTAEVIAVSLPIAMVAFGFNRKTASPGRLIRLLLGLLMTAGVAVTGSRGGLLGLGVGAFALWFLEKDSPEKGKRALAAAFVGLLVVGAGSTFAWISDTDRWRELRPVTGRLALWAAGGEVLSGAPITGVGLGHTAVVLPDGLRSVTERIVPKYHRWLPTTLVDRLDNDWLQVAVERGIPAGLLLLALWARAAWTAYRRSRRDGTAFDSAVVASLLTLGFFSSLSAPLHTLATAALFWVLIGLAAARPFDMEDDLTPVPTRSWPWLVAAALCGIAAVVGGTAGFRVHAANAQAGKGSRLLRSGQASEAAERLRDPLHEMPWLTAASIDRARALVDSGRAAEALVVIDDGKRWRASEWLWAVEARALHQLGLHEQAHRVLDGALAILPRSPVLLEAREKRPPGHRRRSGQEERKGY
jgi:O-antigen ligase